MATVFSNSVGTSLGTALQQLLQADAIQPGSEPGYQTCKVLYLWHPLGAKMAESPITVAQSQQREIAIPDSPEEAVRERFLEVWEDRRIDDVVINVMSQSRVYGQTSMAIVTDDKNDDPAEPIDFRKLSKPGAPGIAFSTFDPLNSAGSLVLNQMPNAFDFQKVKNIRISGQEYHPSRSVVMFNERPMYISYTAASFGYVGRSVYQRALYPLKSFINTMITDDMVALKAGILIAKMKQPGSIVSNLMQAMAGVKRALLKEAQVTNVLQIGPDDSVESLNLQNLDGAFGNSRTNILKNIATAADMPAKLLENETLVQGFGEGTEDAKNIARYIDRVRRTMQPLYQFLDYVVQHMAWNEEFYRTIQDRYSDYKGVPYETAFKRWQNCYRATWPNLLIEPESERIQVEDVKFKAVVALLEVLLPMMDPENRIRVIEWACDQFNATKLLFGASYLDLDMDTLESYGEEQEELKREQQEQLGAAGGEGEEPKPPKPGRLDAAQFFGAPVARLTRGRHVLDYDTAVSALIQGANEAVERRRAALEHGKAA
jgi:Protein of unknown function (DUF1073)